MPKSGICEYVSHQIINEMYNSTVKMKVQLDKSLVLASNVIRTDIDGALEILKLFSVYSFDSSYTDTEFAGLLSNTGVCQTEEHLLDLQIKQITDTVTHKKYVLDACLKMSKYLVLNRDTTLAFQLMQRALVHDISKYDMKEFDALTSISNDMSCMKDASIGLTDDKKNAIILHWRVNSHHPEYWEDYYSMTELDIIEAVCDWYSRSLQYNTYLLDFVKSRQENRFHFPDDIFDKILRYCRIILA